MDTASSPSSHIVITFEIPALSEFITYLKDEPVKQRKIDDLTEQIAQLTIQLKKSGGMLATSVK